MRINCGFCRKKLNGKGYEHKNIADIEIIGLNFEKDSETIREKLMGYKPEGYGWCITGYAVVDV